MKDAFFFYSDCNGVINAKESRGFWWISYGFLNFEEFHGERVLEVDDEWEREGAFECWRTLESLCFGKMEEEKGGLFFYKGINENFKILKL